MKKILKIVGQVTAIFVVAFVFVVAVNASFDKQEKVECYKWQSQAKEFQSFFVTSWQKAQCDAHSISIDAPVKE